MFFLELIDERIFKMNFDIFEVIIIILSSGLATGLATAMFDTFIRSRNRNT